MTEKHSFNYSITVAIMSVQKLPLFILITSMCAFLLHAKSLRIERESSIITVEPTVVSGNLGGNDQLENKYIIHTTKRTADSSCSPDVNQLEYFGQMYSGSSSISSSNGNTMYYALRALQTERSTTASRTTAEEDNALITSITDQTRFTPAGMDTANKVVCARILQELDAVADSISNTALCGWDYVCDYKADRFPNYLFKARCRTSMCSGNCNQENSSHNRCQSHGIHVTVLQMRGNCEEWVWGQELLPIACTCNSDVMMNV